VTYLEGATINLGNYETARVQVGITMPCVPSEEGVKDTLYELKRIVSTELAIIAKEYKQIAGLG
jgi:hypothetical protein